MNGGRDEHRIPRDGAPHPARVGPRPRRHPLHGPLPAPAARALTCRDALSHAPGYALHVSLCYMFAGLGFVFLRSLSPWGDIREWADAGYIVDLLSIVVVYPCCFAIGLACFRFFPGIMIGRRSQRAILTGALAAFLVWCGLGELVIKASERAGSSWRVFGEGWMIALVVLTPFAICLTIAHALGLLIPSERVAPRTDSFHG